MFRLFGHPYFLAEDVVLIISKESNREIAKSLGKPYSTFNISYFPDNGFCIKIFPYVPQNQNVLLIHSIESERNFLELLVILSHYSVEIVCFPYNSYLRNEDGSQLISQTLKNFGVKTIITLDAHTYHKNIVNINAFDFWMTFFDNSHAIVAPDEGAANRNIKSDINLKKERQLNGNIQIIDSSGEILGKKCLIIDDIIDTGKTIDTASKFLLENGARSVTVAVTHAISSKKFLPNKKIEKIWVTNTLKHKKKFSEKFQIVDITKFLANEIKNLIN